MRALNERLSDAQVLGTFTLLVIAVGLGVVGVQGGGDRWTALLWAIACLACGALGGFIFAIPRVQQDEPTPAQSGAPPAQIAFTRRKYKLLANTNLEQISDWLTKIIVGVGLVEAKQLPDYLYRLCRFVAGGLQSIKGAEVFALAITLYFGVWGFIGAYLMTRVYLTGTFFRAEGGGELSVLPPADQ
jgi:hypothetical protein